MMIVGADISLINSTAINIDSLLTPIAATAFEKLWFLFFSDRKRFSVRRWSRKLFVWQRL